MILSKANKKRAITLSASGKSSDKVNTAEIHCLLCALLHNPVLLVDPQLAATAAARAQAKQQVPSVEELIAARNYVGAITVLNFKRQGVGRSDIKLAEWLAYAHFHHGEHDKVCNHRAACRSNSTAC